MTLATIVALSCLLVFWHGSTDYVLSHWPDDALFYDLIARSIAHGSGSTVDGIAPTNGYHPLWMLLHVPLALTIPDPLAVEVFLNYVILAIDLIMLHRFLRRRAGRWIALGACVIAAADPGYHLVIASGMETSLAFLALLLVLKCVERDLGSAMKVCNRWGLTAALALLFFARLDGGLMWIAFGGLVLTGSIGGLETPSTGRASRLRRRIRFLVQVLWVPVLLAILYLALNQWLFSSPIPISGRIKSLGPSALTDPSEIGKAVTRLLLLFHFSTLDAVVARVAGDRTSAISGQVIALACLLLAARTVTRSWRRRHRDPSLALLSAYVVLHSGYYTLLQGWTFALHWARGPELLLLTVALTDYPVRSSRHYSGGMTPRSATSMADRLRAYSSGPFVVASMSICAIAYNAFKCTRNDVVWDLETESRAFGEAVTYISKNLPPTEIVASESIGFLGYLTHRPVFCVNGLLASAEYDRNYLGRKRQLDYLRQHAIRFVTYHVPGGIDPVAYACTSRLLPGLRPDSVRVVARFGYDRPGTPGHRYVLFEIL